MIGNESFVVTWRGFNTSTSSYQLYGRTFDGTNSTYSTPFAASYGGASVIEYSDRNSVVMTSSTTFYVTDRQLTPGSTTSTLAVLSYTISGGSVSWTTNSIYGSTTNSIYDASIGADASGNLLVVWSEDISSGTPAAPTNSTQVRAKYFGVSTGWDTSPRTVVSSAAYGVLTNVKADSKGRFAIAIYQVPEPTTTATNYASGTFVTWFDPTLAAFSTPSIVSTTNSPTNVTALTAPGLAIAPDDEVLVAWTGFNSDQSNSEIYAQRFTPPNTVLQNSDFHGDGTYDFNGDDGPHRFDNI